MALDDFRSECMCNTRTEVALCNTPCTISFQKKQEITMGLRDDNSPRNTSCPLREIGGRIQRLPYADMMRLVRIIQTEQRESPYAVTADVLLATAKALETEPC